MAHLLMLDELLCECPATGQLLGDTTFLPGAILDAPLVNLLTGAAAQCPAPAPYSGHITRAIDHPVLLSRAAGKRMAAEEGLSVLSLLRNRRGVPMAIAAFSTVNDGVAVQRPISTRPPIWPPAAKESGPREISFHSS